MSRSQSCEYVRSIRAVYNDCLMRTNGPRIDSALRPNSSTSVSPLIICLANFSPPVCASTCADFATSEERIIMTPDFCGGNSTSLTDLRINLVRADFTVCALPANSLRYQIQTQKRELAADGSFTVRPVLMVS